LAFWSGEARTGLRAVTIADSSPRKGDNGVAAAEITALVPILRASRRVLLPSISIPRGEELTEQYHEKLSCLRNASPLAPAMTSHFANV
jgi:hypothetical protein